MFTIFYNVYNVLQYFTIFPLKKTNETFICSLQGKCIFRYNRYKHKCINIKVYECIKGFAQ